MKCEMKAKKMILLFITSAIVFIGAQILLFKEPRLEIPNSDFILANSEVLSSENSRILKTACYDCHSNETKYPWHTRFQPVRWWIQGHVDHGKGKLNFSLWEELSENEKNEMLNVIIREIKANEMPPSNYLIMHSEAHISKEELDVLVSNLSQIK